MAEEIKPLPISLLPPAGPLTGTENFPLDQELVTKHAKISQVLEYIVQNLQLEPGAIGLDYAADIAELKAKNTTSDSVYPEAHLVVVRSVKKIFLLNRSSVLADNGTQVIAPTVGPGRWIDIVYGILGPEAQYVKTVNGIGPDANGNVVLEFPDFEPVDLTPYLTKADAAADGKYQPANQNFFQGLLDNLNKLSIKAALDKIVASLNQTYQALTGGNYIKTGLNSNGVNPVPVNGVLKHPIQGGTFVIKGLEYLIPDTVVVEHELAHATLGRKDLIYATVTDQVNDDGVKIGALVVLQGLDSIYPTEPTLPDNSVRVTCPLIGPTTYSDVGGGGGGTYPNVTSATLTVTGSGTENINIEMPEGGLETEPIMYRFPTLAARDAFFAANPAQLSGGKGAIIHEESDVESAVTYTYDLHDEQIGWAIMDQAVHSGFIFTNHSLHPYVTNKILKRPINGTTVTEIYEGLCSDYIFIYNDVLYFQEVDSVDAVLKRYDLTTGNFLPDTPSMDGSWINCFIPIGSNRIIVGANQGYYVYTISSNTFAPYVDTGSYFLSGAVIGEKLFAYTHAHGVRIYDVPAATLLNTVAVSSYTGRIAASTNRVIFLDNNTVKVIDEGTHSVVASLNIGSSTSVLVGSGVNLYALNSNFYSYNYLTDSFSAPFALGLIAQAAIAVNNQIGIGHASGFSQFNPVNLSYTKEITSDNITILASNTPASTSVVVGRNPNSVTTINFLEGGKNGYYYYRASLAEWVKDK